jgi:trk system potassium uptake protein TrkH
MVTAISAVASAIGNVGPALGAAGPTHDYLGLSAGARAVLMVIMLTGRLEVFPVLLGIVPLFRLVTDRLPAPMRQYFLRLGRG